MACPPSQASDGFRLLGRDTIYRAAADFLALDVVGLQGTAKADSRWTNFNRKSDWCALQAKKNSYGRL